MDYLTLIISITAMALVCTVPTVIICQKLREMKEDAEVTRARMLAKIEGFLVVLKKVNKAEILELINEVRNQDTAIDQLIIILSSQIRWLLHRGYTNEDEIIKTAHAAIESRNRENLVSVTERLRNATPKYPSMP
jgi:hypothetical protein